jgi:two-component system, chemotaxis family, CheB/CheR fusion protein
MAGMTPPKPDPAVKIPERILIVDDYVELANGLANWLRRLGSKVEVAFDGSRGIAAAETFRPNLILLDIGLPDITGYEVAERIRGQSWGKQMTLVAITAHKLGQERSRIQTSGFDAYLVKPLVYRQVQSLLTKYSE